MKRNNNSYSKKSTKSCIGVIILVFLILIFMISTNRAVSQQDNNPNGVAGSIQQNENNETNKTNKGLTVWTIIEMTDWLLWPFILITAAGIMLIFYRLLLEHQEKRRAKDLLHQPVQVHGLRDIERTLRLRTGNRAARLLLQLMNTYKKTRHAGPLSNDVNQFLTEERQSFESFMRVLAYLSDSAGALGLLGTVWGIFITFHSGKLDGSTILRGMSISLVTTLVGLIISLVLNMGATGVFTLFNGQLTILATRAEELRQAFLYLEAKTNATQATSEQHPDLRQKGQEYPTRQSERKRQPEEILF